MKSFKVSNFRLFGNEGAEVSFKPITILTGRNSSGKSSFVKSLVALSDYQNLVLDEFQKSGGLNPGDQHLELLNNDLNLRGFTSIKNRNAGEEDCVRFSVCYNIMQQLNLDYQVTYSFNNRKDYKNAATDFGYLVSVSITRKDEDILVISRDKDSKFKLETVNLNNALLRDFFDFCRLSPLPYQIVSKAINRYDGSYLTEYCDDNGSFSPSKTAETEEGERLAYLQGLDTAVYGFNNDAYLLDEELSGNDEFSPLFSSDLWEPLEKCAEFNIIFYFPVLEKFVNKNKAEAISILKQECKGSRSLGYFRKESEFVSRDVDIVIDDFSKSSFDSFLDYYREQENYVLEHINNSIPVITRWGKKYNIIEDGIINKINVSFDDGGFTTRNRKETIFSLLYNMLSSWQWAEGEQQDDQWMAETADGHELYFDNLWEKDDAYIQRSVNVQYSSFSSSHKLFKAYISFIRLILTKCLLSDKLSRLFYDSRWVGTKRFHVLDSSYSLSKSLKKYADLKPALNNLMWETPFGKEDSVYVPDTFLNKWLHEFKICQELELNSLEGYAVTIKLKHNNGVTENLADVGQGITQIVSILLKIESVIIEESYRSHDDMLGVLPEPILAIEEPEVSLHPCFQSMIADMLEDAATNYGIRFIVETHSEYLIRKTQAIVSRFTKEEFDNNPFIVYYFNEDGSVKELGFKESGRFKESFGPGFFDESARLKYVIRSKEQATK